MKSSRDGGWLPHEIAFVLFFGITSVRLFAIKGDGIFWGLIFSGLAAFVFGLKAWARQYQNEWRQRIRLLLYLPLMLVSYKACGFAVPIFHPGATFFLADADQWLLGKDAAFFLEPWVNPHLTDLFYSLYLFFFVYLGISLWHYGRGDLQTLRQFVSGLFTVYGIGFIGYTFLPAGGPYLEIPGHFSAALTGSWITNSAAALVVWGSNRVDCFPCLHFAVTFFILVFDYWHCQRRFYWMVLPCVGIWISTIYLRQHYLVDLFGGLVLSVFALWLIKPSPPGIGSIEKSDGN
jgi:hypothetical protein